MNAEIDRRLMEFQSPKEVILTVTGASSGNVFFRARKLGLKLERITDSERDHLLVRRKEAGK